MGNANQAVADIYSGYTGVPADEHIDKSNDDVGAYTPPELEDNGEGGDGDQFVVADHNIDDVKDFVNEHPDQREAVLKAEQDRGDDARVTLVEWLEHGGDE